MSELAGTEAQLEQEPLDDVDASEHLPAEIEPVILRKYFSLTRADLDAVERCRGSANKLGFSAQLCTLRWRGHFLADTRDVPAVVIEVLAPQLGLLPMLITNYPRDEKTRWAHLERIRRHLGFVRCDRAQRQHLLEHLTRVARSAPRTETLRRAAHAWLLEHHVVRPRRTTLRNLVATARETGLQQTFDALTRDLSEAQRSRLDGLLATAETPVSPDESPKVVDDETVDESRSRLDRFKTPPHRESPAVLLGLLERLETIEKLDFAGWPPLAEVHPAARRLLAGWGYHYDAWNLRRFQPPKRYAVLVCFLQAALAETTDATWKPRTSSSRPCIARPRSAVTNCCAPARKRSGARSKCSKWWGRWCSTSQFPTCSSGTKFCGGFPARRWRPSSTAVISCVMVTMVPISA